jgi:hypothetical protein
VLAIVCFSVPLALANVFAPLQRRQEACTSQCALVNQALETCVATSAACYCPAYLEGGAACSACWATISPAFASGIGVLMTDCTNLNTGPAIAPTPTATANGDTTPTSAVTMGASPCSSQCGPAYQVLATCTSLSNSPACFCPGFVAAGAGCSACLATVDPILASNIGVLVTDCAGYSAAVTTAVLPNTITTPLPAPTTAESTGVFTVVPSESPVGTSPVNKSGARRVFEGDHYIAIVMVFVFVASLFGLFM